MVARVGGEILERRREAGRQKIESARRTKTEAELEDIRDPRVLAKRR